MSIFTIHKFCTLLDQYQKTLSTAQKIHNNFDDLNEDELLELSKLLKTEVINLKELYEINDGSLDRHLYFLNLYLNKKEKTNCKSDIIDVICKDLPRVLENIINEFKITDHYDQELLSVINPRIQNKHYSDIIRNSFIILTERLRKNFKQPKDLDGVTLVNAVFGKKSVVQLTNSTEKEPYRDLIAGLYAVFRNKYAHEAKEPNQIELFAIIEIVNYILIEINKLCLNGNNS